MQYIAERTYQVKSQDLESFEVTVSISTPFIDDNDLDGDWQCEYRITGGKMDVRRKIHGGDSFQSLLLCIKLLESEIKSLKNTLGNSITYLGSNDLLL